LGNIYTIFAHKKEVTGVHNTSTGHSHCNLKVQIIGKVIPNTPSYILESEEFWIKKFATKDPYGLNKYD
jgi:hypothetical protein